ncbi:MAG: hypothetical protein CVV45_01890 [Spirochaetae bacterium HGW-Spirochaetae-10]|nr:MAG: hypothetical protein CVV45_01890 [Spirochaetae bacterium HGW-Spirochaetae-10]
MLNLDFKGRRLKKEIISLLSEVPDLPKADRDNVTMFLEGGEWGLAFDSLCHQIFENDITIGENFYARAASIASSMQIENSEWAFLRKQVR